MNRWLATSLSLLLLLAHEARQETPKRQGEKQIGVGTELKPAVQKPASVEDKEKAAEELWQKAVAAKGGLDPLKAVKTRMTISQATITASPEILRGSMTTTVSYPDKISTEFKIGNHTVYRILAGDTFWVFATRARQLTTSEKALSGKRPDFEALRFQKILEGDPIAFFILGSDPSSERAWLDPLDGKPGLMVKLKNGHAFKAYFNPQTALLEKLHYGEITTLYSDYRPVNGIQLPFKMETFRGTAKTEEQLITDFKLNVTVPQSTFSPPG